MAEGDGLLNRYTVKICIGGSNPPLSAIINTGRTLNRGFEPVPADAGTSNTGNPTLSAILNTGRTPYRGRSNLCLRMRARMTRNTIFS